MYCYIVSDNIPFKMAVCVFSDGLNNSIMVRRKKLSYFSLFLLQNLILGDYVIGLSFPPSLPFALIFLQRMDINNIFLP